jgi:DNA-binding beta-propeller fold protein YncE
MGASCLALLVAIGAGVALFDRPAQAQGAPAYRNVPLWPRPFVDDSWVIGSVTGVATDAQNNVWVAHRGNESLEANERGMIPVPGGQGQPSSSVCCMAAPFILQYDPNGKLINSWGGASSGYQWPQATGGIAVDAKGNVWITAAGLEVNPNPPTGRGRGGAPGGAPEKPPPPPIADAHVLKFSSDGRYLMTIGTPGKMDGPESQTTLNRPSAVAYDSAANEVFVADMGNKRIAVFDADKGTYKRHFGGGATPFSDVTCVEIARDGMVYVCDKSNNRIAVFDKSGKFVKEGYVAKNTGGGILAGSFGVINAKGSVWDVAFSNDQAQRWLFVADGMNKKIRILNRDTLTEAGTFGSGGRYPGQFLVVNSIATDSQGNVYTGETHHGKRVQKFVPGK